MLFITQCWMVRISENMEVQVECLIVFSVELYPFYNKQGLEPTLWSLLIMLRCTRFRDRLCHCFPQCSGFQDGLSALAQPCLYITAWTQSSAWTNTQFLGLESGRKGEGKEMQLPFGWQPRKALGHLCMVLPRANMVPDQARRFC